MHSSVHNAHNLISVFLFGFHWSARTVHVIDALGDNLTSKVISSSILIPTSVPSYFKIYSLNYS